MWAEAESDSITSRLRNGRIQLVPRSFIFKGSPDVLDMDAGYVLENLNILPAPFTGRELSEIRNEDDFYCFLFIMEISRMRKQENWPLSELLKRIAGMARKAYDNDKLKASAADYITQHKEDIFPASLSDAGPAPQSDADPDSQIKAEIEYVSLDFVVDNQAGFNEQFFEYLCRNCFNLIVYRFDKLGYAFKTYPDLFSVLFSSSHIDLEKSSCVVALDILKRKYSKEKDRYKGLINTYAADLCNRAEPFGKALSEENLLKREPVIKSVNSFLNAVRSPGANDFAKYVNKAAELKRKVSHKRMERIKDIFAGSVEIWKHPNFSLRDLTHIRDSGASRLNIELGSYQITDLKQCFIYIIRGNFLGRDNFQDESFLYDMQFTEECYTATFQSILRDQAALDKFSGQLKLAVQVVSIKLPQSGDGLSEDTELLLSMLDSLVANAQEPGRKLEIFCYSASMFLCSLTEKLLRLFSLYTAEDVDVPSNKILGNLLSTDNEQMTKNFGRAHILLLEYFLIGMPGTKLGKCYRNSLAHWSSGMRPGDMTPKLVSSLMWLFTDILNSVSVYLETHTDADSHDVSADKT